MLNLPPQALLLDIETSGLSKEKDVIISIGIYYKDDSGILKHKNWFLEHPDEEAPLLQEFTQFIKKSQTLYSYKGKVFDYPFLLSRMRFHQINTESFQRLKLVDCYPALKYFGKTRESLEKQTTYQRKSSCSGRDVIKLYHTYVKSKDAIYKSLILKHQQDELDSLCHLLEVYFVLYGLSSLKFLTKETKEDTLTLVLENKTPFTTSFNGNHKTISLSWQQGEKHCTVKVALFEGELKHFLTPVKDYYYIPSQNQLMHRSLATFIPNHLKRKAAKDECYLTKQGLFVNLFTKHRVNIPIWTNCENELYVTLEDFEPALLCNQLFYLCFNQDKA